MPCIPVKAGGWPSAASARARASCLRHASSVGRPSGAVAAGAMKASANSCAAVARRVGSFWRQRATKAARPSEKASGRLRLGGGPLGILKMALEKESTSKSGG